MTEDGSKENKLASCCISHEFYKSASKSPNKIAVVHAYGGTKVAREFRKFYSNNDNLTTISDVNDDSSFFDEFFASKTLSSHPSVYEGDQCFTYSEILSAVDSLSFRLRRILDGGDDPHLIKPTSGDLPGKQSPHVQIFSSSTSPYLGVEPITKYHNTFTPRIVGIYMAPSLEYIIAVLSVLRCGEAFMPLDPSWPEERVLQVVSSSEADLIIVRESSIDGNFGRQGDKLDWLVDNCRCALLYISMEDKLQHQVSSSRLLWPCEKKKLRPFCYLMYTSGSTGKPKGVCGTEIGLVNRFLWMQNLYPPHGEESLLFKTSISFIDHLQEFLGALLTTSTLVIPPFNVLKENLFYVVNLIQAYSINRLVAVPSLMRAILPALQSAYNMGVQSSLNLLVLSGEVLYLDLLGMLVKLLPTTAILNLYGSTEVSGDCTYFDCKRLPLIMDGEKLSSVPIGLPISNCDVVLVGEDAPNQGEIYVSGLCTSVGYFCYSSIMPLDHILLPQDSCFGSSSSEHKSQYYFRTGDFARKLQSGDLVFLGRKDRSIKVNGQRIALEEIESTLREHPDVVDAAVVSRSGQGEVTVLEAYLMTKQKDESGEGLISSIRSWMISKVPLAMIPSHFFFTQSFPMSSTGKVEYTSLASSTHPMRHVRNEIEESDLLQVIKKTFCDVLMVEKVSDDDNFFEMGGTSISAAHASYNLGIDMRLLYAFPNPLKLQLALLEEKRLSNPDLRIDAYLGVDVKMPDGGSLLSFDSRTSDHYTSKPRGRLFRTLSNINPDYPTKYLKMDSNSCMKSKDERPKDGYFWDQSSVHMACSFSRCNNVVHEGDYEGNTLCHAVWSLKIPRDQRGCMKRLWQVHMESCVDASPLVVFKERDILVFIGSHSHKFLCINAKSGLVKWEIKLEGRIECSAAIVDSFSQVIVGCYQGNIYFLDFLNGSICWTFQTCGQVKSQPLVDKCRHLVWCGSYDHNLYALDYRNYVCIYKLPCGGSIFGSPAIDKVHEMLYVASTSGRLTAISIKAMPFSKLWLQEFGAPIFGSISINLCNGNVICCLVDGHVVAVDTSGSIIWRGKTGGPIFAGPCISRTLASQVLICSRDGSIYSFELESGDLLWEHNVGDPITSSAYVDENLQLISDVSHLSDRLICVTTSSGGIHLLRINLDAVGEAKRLGKDVVQEFARLDIQGDIFSSPVMIGGRIFVGCRDDFVHCIEVGVEITM